MPKKESAEDEPNAWTRHTVSCWVYHNFLSTQDQWETKNIHDPSFVESVLLGTQHHYTKTKINQTHPKTIEWTIPLRADKNPTADAELGSYRWPHQLTQALLLAIELGTDVEKEC